MVFPHPENILGLDIPVDDVLGVHKTETVNHIQDDVRGLGQGVNCIFFLRLDIGDVAEIAILHNHENPAVIWDKEDITFECSGEVDDVGVVQGLKDRDFLFEIPPQHWFFDELLFAGAFDGKELCIIVVKIGF